MGDSKNKKKNNEAWFNKQVNMVMLCTLLVLFSLILRKADFNNKEAQLVKNIFSLWSNISYIHQFNHRLCFPLTNHCRHFL